MTSWLLHVGFSLLHLLFFAAFLGCLMSKPLNGAACCEESSCLPLGIVCTVPLALFVSSELACCMTHRGPTLGADMRPRDSRKKNHRALRCPGGALSTDLCHAPAHAASPFFAWCSWCDCLFVIIERLCGCTRVFQFMASSPLCYRVVALPLLCGSQLGVPC